MRKEDIINAATSVWSIPIVFASKTDGLLRFYVQYWKLMAVTVRDSYSPLQMNERIDLLDEEYIFWALRADSDY